MDKTVAYLRRWTVAVPEHRGSVGPLGGLSGGLSLGELVMDQGVPHTLMEYAILLLLGGGGAWKARDVWRDKHGTDKNSTKLKKYIEEAHKPLLEELKGLCKTTQDMANELHTYIEIQKDRDRRGRV